ncbi:unnamed protein product [Tetraodon nigroviridis]|uniref:(spotted green pufferfish) hypothetical protein n=1 Tax=Tetraodon nigroviridis TaxID=99883 RepID=Q4SJL5_TETNG|nr:unnamed protein product [Tetraodon nigroviridis]
MADQSRQTKLAAAKKKLKEFQQKSSPNVAGEKGSSTGGAGAKKKRKVKGPSQPDAPLSDRNSPDNFDSILKVLRKSNGVALPPYSNSQTFADAATIGSSVSQMLEDPTSEPKSNPANTNTATNSEPVSQNSDLQVCLTPLHLSVQQVQIFVH